MNALIIITFYAAAGWFLRWTDNDRRTARSDHAARQRLLTELERADRR